MTGLAAIRAVRPACARVARGRACVPGLRSSPWGAMCSSEACVRRASIPASIRMAIASMGRDGVMTSHLRGRPACRGEMSIGRSRIGDGTRVGRLRPTPANPKTDLNRADDASPGASDRGSASGRRRSVAGGRRGSEQPRLSPSPLRRVKSSRKSSAVFARRAWGSGPAHTNILMR